MEKRELLERLQTGMSRLEALTGSVPPARLNEPGVNGDWSVKDVLAHLTAWQNRTVAWVEAALHGLDKPAAAPWPPDRSEEETNAWIFQASHNLPVERVLADWKASGSRLLAALESLPGADLNRSYEWLGGNSLAASIPGNSYDHYDDHYEMLLAWLQPAA